MQEFAQYLKNFEFVYQELKQGFQLEQFPQQILTKSLL